MLVVNEDEVFDGYAHTPTGVPTSFPTGLTLTQWLTRWLDRPVYPPVLVQDGDRWRPGTEEEEGIAWMAELERLRNPEPFDDGEDWPH